MCLWSMYCVVAMFVGYGVFWEVEFMVDSGAGETAENARLCHLSVSLQLK